MVDKEYESILDLFQVRNEVLEGYLLDYFGSLEKAVQMAPYYVMEEKVAPSTDAYNIPILYALRFRTPEEIAGPGKPENKHQCDCGRPHPENTR